MDESRETLRTILSVIFLALFLIVLFYLCYGLYEQKQHQQYAQIKKQVAVSKTQEQHRVFPVRLNIPRINVDAAIENVGVTTTGAMGVPKNTADVGWFDPGPRPGERGSAVIAGHFDDEKGDGAVFANLSKLKNGDMIDIKDSDGKSITFQVQEIRLYNPGYAEDVFSRSDGFHLNLITCDGAWDEIKKSYTKRLIVFADLAQ